MPCSSTTVIVVPWLRTTTSPFSLTTLRMSSENRTTPAASVTWSVEVALVEAVPPTWKVRIVSWVPGSPMDCAAMMPTAAPIWTGFPVARSRP